LLSESKTTESYVEKPKSLADLRAEISAGATKASELAAGYYDRIAEVNPHLNVYLSLTRERALAQAERIDALAAKGDPLPPLAGVPVAIKDVMVMQGAAATAGSKILKGYHPPYDATAVARLEAAGAVLLGKLNCDEFAMGSSNAIRWIRSAFRADRAAARRRRWQPTWRWPRWGPTPAGRSGSRPVFAAWWACCRRGDGCRAMASSRLPRRWTGLDRLPETCATRLRCWE
jgi:hypothetical protein